MTTWYYLCSVLLTFSTVKFTAVRDFQGGFGMFGAGWGSLGGWAGFCGSSMINTCMKQIEGEPMAQIDWSYYLSDDKYVYEKDRGWTHGSI